VIVAEAVYATLASSLQPSNHLFPKLREDVTFIEVDVGGRLSLPKHKIRLKWRFRPMEHALPMCGILLVTQ
jgi:hypothetical protein